MFLLHGTPGSRHGPKPRHSVLYRLGVRLIAYDRPGYGGSTPSAGRSVADAAYDVEAIADDLKIDRFAVVGRSGGGPHALACAALLPTRVARAAVLVSFAHPKADLDWFEGMSADNSNSFVTADLDPLRLAETLSRKAERTLRNPESLLAELEKEMTSSDKRVVHDVSIRRQIAQSYVEALRTGPHGWIDDVLALRRDWGFDLSDISVPVRLWHGEQDRFAPASHTRWLAARIPGAEVHVEPDAAHFGSVEILPETLDWLAGW